MLPPRRRDCRSQGGPGHRPVLRGRRAARRTAARSAAGCADGPAAGRPAIGRAPLIADTPGPLSPGAPAPRFVTRRAADARATEVAPGLWCLRLPLRFVAPRSVNAYLFALDRGFCLVDCGTSLAPGWDALAYALEQAGVSPEQITLLVCTHLHADHAGLTAEVIARTGCEFARGEGPPSADHVLRDPAVPFEQRRRLGVREGIPLDELTPWIEPEPEDDLDYPRLTPDRLLHDGDVIDSRIGAWTVVPAPGHSSAQILLYNASRRWLIMADLAYEGGEPFFEYGHRPDPYADHIGSLNRALELEVELAFAGHGRVVESPARRLRIAHDAAVRSCARVGDALSSQPRTAHDLALQLLGDRHDWGERQSMLSVVLCVCEHLEGAGRVRAEIGADGVRRWRAS